MKLYGLLFKTIIGLVVVALIFGAGVWGASKYMGTSAITTETTISSTSQILSIEREEQIVLLSLHMSGLERRDSSGKFFNLDVPGSTRTKFVQHSFNAKLGVDGKDVEITRVGEGQFLVSVPAFIFIGHDDIKFAESIEKNGALSWVTPKHDDLEIANHILGEEKQQEYLSSQQDLLEDQAKAFYRDIVHAIDPTVDLDFEFRE